MIAVIDYGVGNLFSLSASLKYLGIDTVITNRKEDIISADKIILPGVGAFEDAMTKLKEAGLINTIIEETGNGKFLLGICLGMQLLFEKSCEYGEHEGLGLIKGKITEIKKDLSAELQKVLKVPHIGWNDISLIGDERRRGIVSGEKDQIFKYVEDGSFVYFVHSYYGIECEEQTIATAEYGIPLTAAVRNGSVYGTQFHPEKSGDTGLRILKAFAEL